MKWKCIIPIPVLFCFVIFLGSYSDWNLNNLNFVSNMRDSLVDSFLSSDMKESISGTISRKSQGIHQGNVTNSRQHLQTYSTSNKYAVGKNTSSSHFIYDEKKLYSSIQQVRGKAGYKHPWNDTCVKRVPKCIIIGVKKAGTRELIDFMSLHPNIVIKTDPYEIGYFSKNHYRKDKLGTDWYRSQMPCSYSDQITVTKYPWYFASQTAAQRIHDFNRTIKLIVIVREPVKRLVSGYTFDFVNSHKHKTFSKLQPIERKLLLKNGAINTNYEEVQLSSYDVGITNYLKYFDLNQILIIDSNEFKYKPYLALKRVESFLGLSHIIKPGTFVYNPGKDFYCIGHNNSAFCYGSSRGRIHQPELSEDTRKKLNDYFRPHNENFYNIIGKRYEW